MAQETSMISPFMYAIKRMAESPSDNERKNTVDIIAGAVSGKSYNEKFGRNNTRLNDPAILNDISKLLLSSTEETIKRAIDTVIENVEGDSIGAEPNIVSIVKADGLSKTAITFDLSIYEGKVSDEKDMGYNPIFYYINRFKSVCDVEVLNKLASKFSPFLISVKDGTTDGYNAIGVLAASMTIREGQWESPELVDWIKTQISDEFAGRSGYEIFVGAGNVRDMTGGNTLNAYGTVTNILRIVNSVHREYQSTKEDDDPEFDPMPLISAILPSQIDSLFYEEWMIEFGQEVD
jgi:hypothetical protein